MRNILIVDDEPMDLAALKEMLDEPDYRFITATTGHEARELIEGDHQELTAILLDWVLSDTDGVELLRWMKSQPRLADVEVVIHSADFEPDNVERAIACGAYYYLTKPFDEAQLEALMRAAITACELKRSLAEKVRATEDAFKLLELGRFRFRSVQEADLLAIHIASACGTPDMSVGLRELLVNAVEHGNLGITYDEKGQLLAEHQLDAECRRRLALPDYRDRRVEITLHRLPDSMEITIKDEGTGFDYQRFMTMDEERLFDSHGRGVLMASATLQLEYLHPGNHVRVRLPICE